LTKLGTYLVLKRIWNPIEFQGHRVKFLGEGICHALRCPCFVLLFNNELQKCVQFSLHEGYNIEFGINKREEEKNNGMHKNYIQMFIVTCSVKLIICFQYTIAKGMLFITFKTIL
jgi:hypothetical protein